jgi:small neutral amino acid transporter SnatA (MarC family)
VSFAFYAFAFFAVANPFRWRLSLPEDGGVVRRSPLIVGLGLTVAAAVLVAAVAGSVLDWLDISPETWRIAAGVVVIGAGLWVTVFPQRHREPELSGWMAGVVPVFFPVLLAPELFVLLGSTGADEATAMTVAALAIPVAAVAALAMVRRTPAAETVLLGLSRLLGAVAVAAGLALIISGIRDV